MEEAKNQPTTIDEILDRLYAHAVLDGRRDDYLKYKDIYLKDAKQALDAYYHDQFKQMIERAKPDAVDIKEEFGYSEGRMGPLKRYEKNLLSELENGGTNE